MKINKQAKNAWKFYKKNIIKGKKTPKKMFKLGYVANTDETQRVKDLEHYRDCTCGLYATDIDPANLLDKFAKFKKDKGLNTIDYNLWDEWKDFISSRYNPFFRLEKNLIVDTTKKENVQDVVFEVKNEDRIKKLEAIADLLSRIMYYSNFKIETTNERTVAALLNELKLYPTTEEDIIEREDYEELHKFYKNYQIEKEANI